MIVKCKICGKEFEAKQRNHNICSVECREINQRDSKKTFRENNPDKVKQYIKNCNERKSAQTQTKCRICGKIVDAHYTATGRKARNHYHRDCLVNEAIAAIVRGEKFNKSNKNILRAAANKGYQKSDLLEIMAERGIKYGKQKPFAVWRG